MTATILLFGFLFGAILQSARLNKYNVISGMAMLDNLTVAKAIAIAIGAGVIIINVEIGLGLATYHVKPFLLGGTVLGGLIFGTGMAILGYCPGTMAVSLGEGSLDALVGIIGGLFGGLFYTLVLPGINGILGPNFGNISLNSLAGNSHFVFYLLVLLIGIAFIALAFLLHKKEKATDTKWVYAGILLAILNGIVFLTATTNRPIGASTSYPFLADTMAGLTTNTYFEKIQKPGSWELIFLVGAFLAGIIISLIRKDFKIKLIHTNWEKFKGASAGKRIIWAFIGGFILIFGARMAGGCTSGHILSGGMQLAVSSLVFAIFVFAGLIVTGKLFYKK
jgi:uncharacterized protein